MFKLKKTTNSANRALLMLLAIIILVISLHIVAQLLLHRGAPSDAIVVDTVNRFNLDTEMSVPTWLAALLGIIGGGLAWLIGRVQQKGSVKFAWYLLAGLTLFISIDEVASLHELLLQALHIKAGLGEVQTLTSNAWLFILPFAIAGLVLALIYWYRNLPKRTFWRLLAAFVVYAIGAVVVEYAAIEVDKGTRQYTVGYVVVEEGLEYLGLLLIIRTSLLHIQEFETGLKQKLAKIFS